jgi:hypothetical protein
MRRVIFLLLPLSACASGPLDAVVMTHEQPILVQVTQIDATTYDLLPSPQFGSLNYSALAAAVNQAVQTRAKDLCAPAPFEVTASAVPNILEVYPRTRIRCR